MATVLPQRRAWRHALTRLAPARLGRAELLVLAFVLVAGAVIRVAFLREPMRFDEAFTFQTYVFRDLHGITLTFDTPNNHIFNTLLTHFSVQQFGDQLWAIRLPAFLSGVLVPLAAWWAALELYGRATALWAAVLAATASPLVDFSVNGRGYMLGVLFVLVSLALAARMDRTGSPAAARGFVATAALAVWSVPTSAYGLVGVAVWMLGSAALAGEDRRRRLGRVAGTLTLAALLSALLLWPLTSQTGWNFVTPLPKTWDAVAGLVEATWGLWNRTWPSPVDWLIAAGFVLSVVFHRRIARGGMPLAAAAVLGVVGFALFSERLSPFPRNWISVLPLYVVAAAAGIAACVEIAGRRLRERGGGAARRPAVARLAAVAPVVLVTAVLSVVVLQADQAQSEAPPQTDNEIVSHLQRFHDSQPVLLDYNSFAAPTDYMLRRFGYPVGVGSVQPEQRAAGRVLTVVRRDDAQGAKDLVSRTGGATTPAAPRALKHFKYVSLYEVAIRRS